MALAESMLAAISVIAPEGANAQGESKGFAWQVRTVPYATQADANPRAPKLHEIEVLVRWSDGTREREFQLRSLRPERINKPGEVIR